MMLRNPTHSFSLIMMIFDDELEEVPESTCTHVFERDGHSCWLCGETSRTVNIAHQIPASASEHPFPLLRDNGTISISSLSHCDNLIPLCPTCHTEYDMAFPDWIMVPDSDTLNQYLEHEKKDYHHRHLLSQTSKNPFPRTLPTIDRSNVIYHPLILSTQFRLDRIRTDLPMNWRGDPATVIHRAALRGLMDSNPIQQMHFRNRTFQRGVQPIYQSLIGDLMRLWARAAPRGRL